MWAHVLARAMLCNDMTVVWKDAKRNINFDKPIAIKVDEMLDGCVGGTQIAKMWRCHYTFLLNSVKTGNSKTSVLLDVFNVHRYIIYLSDHIYTKD